jgi:hypothetical protein
MSKSVTGETRWTARPILAGLTAYEAEFQLREKPGSSFPPVATKATAAVIPDMDWRANGVLWGVRFHRYVPQKPLEMRTKRNETMGTETLVPPPPIIEERKVNGRIRDVQDLEAAIAEGRKLCEETIAKGRPR